MISSLGPKIQWTIVVVMGHGPLLCWQISISLIEKFSPFLCFPVDGVETESARWNFGLEHLSSGALEGGW